MMTMMINDNNEDPNDHYKCFYVLAHYQFDLHHHNDLL